MKRILATAALTAVISCTMNLMAEPVSPSIARQAAAKFLQTKGVGLKNEAMRAESRVMGHATDGQETTEASPYYVFNGTDSRGFVVVSGDDCVGDNLILGYSSKGCFEADNIPANMQWWLDATASQISELSQRAVKARSVDLHEDVAPLVTACWNQGENVFNPQNPYNAFCPETDGLLCVTGCMATALSQVLYYHRWPQGQLAAELPAYPTVDGRVMEALPPTTFDWDNMVDDYRQTTTVEQQAAVAELMRYCGQLVQMDYTPQISNGYFYDTDMLVNLFGYDQGVRQADADFYTVGGWDELLYTELREGRPLVYTGMSTGGGHAFVIDGYEVQDSCGYFHVNWGWAGDGDGFFKISLLNPYMSGTGGSSTSDGYCRRQSALIGLQPTQYSEESYGRYLTGFLWNYSDEGQPNLFYVANSSHMPGAFDIALAERHFDGTGDDSQLYAIRTIDMLGYSFAGLNTEKHIGVDAFAMPADFTEGLAPGHHELVFVNKEAGTSAPWRPVYGPNCYVEVNISDEGLPVDTLFHPLPQLTASSRFIKVDGLKQRGLLQTVSATIANNSDDDYIGPLLCSVYYVENGKLTGLVHYTNTGLMIEANSKADVTFTPTTPQAGNYVIVLSNTDGNLTDSLLTNIKQTKGYIGHKSFTVEELAFYVQDFQYNERPDEEGNPAYYLDITVANNTPLDYHAALVANLYKRNDEGGYDPITFPDNAMTYCMIDLQRNNWINAHIRLPEALAPGEYGVDLLIANNFQSLMLRDYFIFAAGPFTVNEPTGISDAPRLNDQGETENEKWFSLDGRQLGARPSSKGIYIHQGKKQVVM